MRFGYYKKGDSKKCLWFGHKFRILKDDKTIWCDRCERDISLFKKGYAIFGLDFVRKNEPRLIWNIPYAIFLISVLVCVIVFFIKIPGGN